MVQLPSSEREVVVRKEVRRLIGVGADAQHVSGCFAHTAKLHAAHMEMWRSQLSVGCSVRTSVVQRGPTSRKVFLKFQTFVLSGRRDDMNEFREGEQTGWLQ